MQAHKILSCVSASHFCNVDSPRSMQPPAHLAVADWHHVCSPNKVACSMQEPCRSYVLRDVICVYCNHCTDLDLCRDPALQAGLLLSCLAHDSRN